MNQGPIELDDNETDDKTDDLIDRRPQDAITVIKLNGEIFAKQINDAFPSVYAICGYNSDYQLHEDLLIHVP